MRPLVAVHLPFRTRNAEDGQRTRGVVRADNVHQVIEHRARIVLTQGFHGFREMLRRAAVQIGENGVAQRIVHHTVEFASAEVAAALGIGDFV